ncbi:MAG: pyrroline-5-carboxylate reductase [Spirochaetia bacterium]|jgi:pyrroline-5-carboxylate reductase|nr:pyrroline-5-carboxylate reductase [Spirochaetia bacterium]
MINKKIGFIGSGNMASAIISGIIAAKVVAADNVYVFDIDKEKVENLKSSLKIKSAASNSELVTTCDILFVAVKPNICSLVFSEIKESLSPEKIIISIAAGWSTEKLRNAISKKAKILKVMPNTPAMYGAGVMICSKDNDLATKEMEEVKSLLSANGLVVMLEEEKMYATTGISGTIPACVSMYIEALADGGVMNGLSRDFALKVAAQAVMGSAKMVLESGKHPGEIKDQVCTPGGTTIEAVVSLEEDGFRGTVIKACNRCTKKSYDMMYN